MRSKTLFSVIFVLLVASMLLVACKPEAPVVTEEPAVEEPVAEEPTVVEPVVEEPTVEEPAGIPDREFLWTQPLREAVAAAIDREVIVDRVFEGRNIPAYHMVPAVTLMPQNLSWINTEPVTWTWQLNW
ncbi:MAG: hypothetical protein IH585_18765 [Anaerolineaceae bacterium]|nr:hypothetical protein [Anaerolineaceae bacterium]